MDWIWYIIVIAYIAITFRAILMWIDKMAKVIVGNYLVWITCFFFWNLIHQWVRRLSISPDSSFLWISYDKYAHFLSAWQLTFVLLLFAVLIWIIYSFGRIQVSFSTRATTEKLYFIILIPITILSFIIGPYIALRSDGIWALTSIESTITRNFWFLVSFVNNMPLLMFLNGIVFIIISSQINIKFSLSAKATKVPEWI